MNTAKISREVLLRCPTCAGTDFQEPIGASASASSYDSLITCAACKLTISRDELQSANAENIDAHVIEMGREAVDQVTKELGEMLRSTFRGSSVIKVK